MNVSTLKTMFNDFRQTMEDSYNGEILQRLTEGVNLPSPVIDAMRGKDWEIEVRGSRQVRAPYNYDPYAVGVSCYSHTDFSAHKHGMTCGSGQWYRDLCDVMNFRRNAIPDTVVRIRAPDLYPRP